MWVRAGLRQLAAGLQNIKVPNNNCVPRCLSMAKKKQSHNEDRFQGNHILRLNSDVDQPPFALSKDQEDFVTGRSLPQKAKLDELLLRLYLKRQEGSTLPEEVRLEDVQNMIDMSPFALKRMLDYLNKRCWAKASRQLKKQEQKENLESARQERSEKLSKLENPWLEYRLHMNSLIPRIFKTNMSRLYDCQMGQGLMFGQKIVVDCSYDSHMDEVRIKHTAKQILLCATLNRRSRRPFAIHLCNLDQESRLMFYLKRLHPEIDRDCPIGIHRCSYMDLFEKKSLVYLTPHTDKTVDYNPNDTYIVGALVDKVLGVPLSSKKAMKDKIRFASLPLKKHLTWKQGGKSLCVHQVFGTLLTVKNTGGDWKKALLENVPQRKIIVPGTQ